MKGVITTIIGFFTFGGVPATLMTISGGTLNAFGGALYVYVRYSEKKRAAADLSPVQSDKKENVLEVKPLNGTLKRHDDRMKHAIVEISPGG